MPTATARANPVHTGATIQSRVGGSPPQREVERHATEKPLSAKWRACRRAAPRDHQRSRYEETRAEAGKGYRDPEQRSHVERDDAGARGRSPGPASVRSDRGRPRPEHSAAMTRCGRSPEMRSRPAGGFHSRTEHEPVAPASR